MTSILFAADDGVHGSELWLTNGTNSRTKLVKDIASGSTASFPSNYIASAPHPFAVLGSYAYFSANNGVSGTELWRSDGTSAGTTQVSEYAGSTGGVPNGFSPANIFAANGKIFFTGAGAAGYGIYDTDGVAAPSLLSTQLAGMDYIIASGTHVYWAVNDGLSTSGLYATDGTTTGKISSSTNEVGLFDAGGGVAYYATTGVGGIPLQRVNGTTMTTVTGAPNAPGYFVNANGTLFFATNSANTLYSTSVAAGSPTTTTVKTGLNLNASTSMPISFAGLGSNLIFANTDANGTELWISNGTSLGTVLLKDIITGSTGPTPNSGAPKNLITVGSKVLFQASDGNGGVDLWKTDGTGAGTVLVKHILSGDPSPNDNKNMAPAPDLQNMSVQNGILYFSEDDGTHGQELWRSDGTTGGTFQVKDISSTPQQNAAYQTASQFLVATIGTKTYFTGNDLAHGYELWSTDGTAAGTAIVADINPGSANSVPTYVTKLGTKVIYTANDGVHGAELWGTDTVTGTTQMLSDIKPGSGNSNIFQIVAIGSKAYFAADDGTHGFELWASDGTPGGTSMLADIYTGSTGGNPNSGSPFGFTSAAGKVFFTATTAAAGAELWVTDGTPGGTAIVKDIASGTAGSSISNMVSFAGKLFFTADTTGTSVDMELWSSDGTFGGTSNYANLNTTAGQGSFPNSLVVANGHLFFTANDGGVNGTQVWQTDGVTAPVKITNIAGASPSNIVVANNIAYWASNTAASGFELLSSTGSGFTTIDIATGANSSSPNNLTAVGNTLFFTAQDTTTHGTELWMSTGGTLATTSLVKDINPTANMGSNPSNLTAVGSLLFFTADDGTNGNELWVSNGTTGGTHIVKDLNPGSTASNPNNLRAAGSYLIFQADDGTHGQELWVTDGTSAGTTRLTDTVTPGASFPASFTTVSFTASGAIRLPDVLLHNNGTGDTRDWGMSAGVIATNLALSASDKLIGTGDFNGDGVTDLLYRNNLTGDLHTSLISSTGAVTTQSLGLIPAGWAMIGSGDFNADGVSDLIWRNISTGDERIWSMSGGLVAANTVVASPPATWSLQGVGDFNGDGSSDMIWRNATTGEIRDLNYVNNALTTTTVLATAPLTTKIVATGDYNGDGTTDILLQDTVTGDVRDWLMLNNAIANNIDIGATSYRVIASGDFNGDGTDDLLWRSPTTGDVREWNMAAGVLNVQNLIGTLPGDWSPSVNPATHNADPNAFGETAVTLPNVILHNNTTLDTRDWVLSNGTVGNNIVLPSAPAGWKIIATGDFNGDGVGDLVYENTATGDLRDWLLNGSGLASNISLGAIPSGWTLVASGDYNGDGISDLMWRNVSTSDIRIWTMAGGSVTANTPLAGPPATWSLLGTGDFNGDGTSDMLWQNTANGEVRAQTVVNNAVVTTTILGSLPATFTVVATGDFNGDGTSDILLQDSSSGDVRDWLMSNGNILSNIDIGATNYHVVAAGDFNGDATTDLLWRDLATGDLREWNMSNGVLGSQNLIGSLPSDWVAVTNAATHSGDPNPSPGNVQVPIDTLQLHLDWHLY